MDAEAQAIVSMFQATGRMEALIIAPWVGFLDFTYKFCLHLMDHNLVTFP